MGALICAISSARTPRVSVLREMISSGDSCSSSRCVQVAPSWSWLKVGSSKRTHAHEWDNKQHQLVCGPEKKYAGAPRSVGKVNPLSLSVCGAKKEAKPCSIRHQTQLQCNGSKARARDAEMVHKPSRVRFQLLFQFLDGRGGQQQQQQRRPATFGRRTLIAAAAASTAGCAIKMRALS